MLNGDDQRAANDSANSVNINKLRDPIEIITDDQIYLLKPTEEEYQWFVVTGRYQNEVVTVLGSCKNNNPTQLVRDRLIVGNSLLFMRESGVRVVSSPIKSFKVKQPENEEERYTSGTVLEGRYKLLNLIGRGGSGLVYRAQHLRLDRAVAIKILHNSNKQTPQLAEQLTLRFQREIHLLTRINHPYIANIIDQGMTAKNDPYMVMDYIQGITLKSYIKQNHPLNYRQIQRVFRQLGLAVHALHELGILHRDLKPENVIVQQLPGGEEIIRLLDFGIAKLVRGEQDGRLQALTQAGAVMGTLDYMSPEQCEGQVVNLRTDIYSLGAILYEMFTGAPPFAGASPMEILMKQIRSTPQPLQAKRPELPLALSDVVMKALEKQPSKRYPDALHFIFTLDTKLHELNLINNVTPLACFREVSINEVDAAEAVTGEQAKRSDSKATSMNLLEANYVSDSPTLNAMEIPVVEKHEQTLNLSNAGELEQAQPERSITLNLSSSVPYLEDLDEKRKE